MVIGLRLRTNEREVTWRYPVAVLGGEIWKGLKEAGREDDERIKVWLVVVLGYTRIRGDERRQRYEKKREKEREGDGVGVEVECGRLCGNLYAPDAAATTH